MIEQLTPLKIPPGIYRNGTPYQAAGRWVDGSLVRFASGTIQPIGGWRRIVDDEGAELAPLAGRPRAAVSWSSGTGDAVVAIGTHSRLYAMAGVLLQDITPEGFEAGLEDAGASDGSGVGEYGAGDYGAGDYGAGSSLATLAPPDTWQLDTFGNYLVAVCTSDEVLYVWPGGGTATPIVNAPSARAVVVTPERFLVALGADGNVRRVQWASQESTDEWAPSAQNTAGDLELATNGRIMCGRRTRGQTLIWTDTDLHTLTYIGGQFVYRVDQAGANCGIAGPNAVAVVDTQAFWMGQRTFFAFDGFVKPLPCEVADHVFGDFNSRERAKVIAVTNTRFHEVTWFYPSADSLENDRYVTYNYVEGHWTVGALGRAAGVDAGPTPTPVLVDPDGLLYEHELPEPPSDPVPYLESGPIELGAGDTVMKVRRLVPDELTLGDVRLTLYAAMFPTAPEQVTGPYNPAEATPLRVTARQVRLRFEQTRATPWRIGTMRLGLLPGGRR